MDDKLLTTKDVAEYFGVTSETVTGKFIDNGLRYIPIGAKDYRYNKKDVIAFEEMLKTTRKTNNYNPSFNRFKFATPDYSFQLD